MKRNNKHIDSLDPEEILERFSSGLEESKAFKVPEGYFDTLPSRIQDEISAQAQKKLHFPRLWGLFTTRRAWIPLLAVTTMLVAIFLFIPGRKNSQNTLAEIHDTLNLKVAYDASYAGDANFEEYVKVNDLLEKPGVKNPDSVSLFKTSYTGISDDDIIDYLKDQELDSEVLAQL